MDPLSGAASVIAIIDMTVKISSTLKDYYEAVRDARQDIQHLYESIEGLRAILITVRDRDGHGDSPTIPILLYDLEHLEKKLGKTPKGADRAGRWVKSLAWPFKKGGVEKTVKNIERSKATLGLEFSVNISEVTYETFNIVEDIKEELDNARNENKRRELVAWLSRGLPDPSKEHEIARTKHEATTGTWLIESPELARWIKADNTLLWLHGGAGVGKSILCSTVIELIKERYIDEPGEAASYWYFTFADEEKQNVQNMLCNVILSLLSNRRGIPPALEKAYKQSNNGLQRPTTANLIELLKVVVDGFRDIYLIVDAIDECPKLRGERAKFVTLVREILSWDIPQMHIFVTSRREQDIVDAFAKLSRGPGHIEEINAHGEQSQQDIEKYITRCLKDDIFEWWSQKLKKMVRKELATQAQGMFRLVALQLDTLSRCGNEKIIRETLNKLPTDLDSLYERMFLEIHVDHWIHVSTALQWIAYAARDISVEEVTEALVVHPDIEPYYSPDERIMDCKYIMKILPAGLYTIYWAKLEKWEEELGSWAKSNSTLAIGEFGNSDEDRDEEHKDDLGPESDFDENSDFENDQVSIGDASLTDEQNPRKQMIRLAHFSVLEYLVSSRIKESKASFFQISEVSSNNTIAEASIAYIIHVAKTNPDVSNLMYFKFPLIHYATRCCTEHLRRLQGFKFSATLEKLCMLLYNEDPSAWKTWLKFGNPTWSTNHPDSGEDVGIDYADPKLLTDGRVGSNLQRYINIHPFSWLCLRGLDNLVCLLLPKVGDINTTGKDDPIVGIPLFAAVKGYSLSTLKILLPAGANFHTADQNGFTALHLAANHSQEKIVRYLIEEGANVNSRAGNGDTPLITALCCVENKRMSPGARATVKALLEKGADPNIPSRHQLQLNKYEWPNLPRAEAEVIHINWVVSPLMIAANMGDLETVTALVEHRADIEFMNSYYGTPVQAAAMIRFAEEEARHGEVVRFLIQQGAKVNAIGGCFRGPLEAAAFSGASNICRLLLEAGADANGRYKLPIEEYTTPLERAIQSNSSDTIQVMTEYADTITQERWDLTFGRLEADAQVYLDPSSPFIKLLDIDIMYSDRKNLALLRDWQERVTDGTCKFPSSDSILKESNPK